MLFVASPGDVFVVGNSGIISHYSGSSWTIMNSGTTTGLMAVWGSSASDVFAVGYGATVLHYDGNEGGNWTDISPEDAATYRGVWGSSGSDVYAVGDAAHIAHYNGSTWNFPSAGVSGVNLNSVWGASASDIFAVGTGGKITHYNGSSWSAMTSNTFAEFRDVWGSSGIDVFAVGFTGWVSHYDGTEWSAMTSNTGSGLLAVWGTSAYDVFAVGATGTIMHFGAPPPPSAPTVTTQAVDEIGTTTATGNGTITDTGGEDCVERGVCWSTDHDPDIDDSLSGESGTFGAEAFTASMTGLVSGETYYVRAYARNSGGYSYGDEVSFSTLGHRP